MPVTRCPGCRQEVDVDAADLGHPVECPACRHAFTARADKPGRPGPPPEPRNPSPRPEPPADADGPRTYVCTECRCAVSVAPADVGHPLNCPLCGKVFMPEDRPPRGRSRANDARRGRRFDDDYATDAADRPRVRRGKDYDDDFNDPDFLIRRAKTDLKSMGVGLQVIGVINVVTGLVQVVFAVLMLIEKGGGGGNGVFGYLLIGGGVTAVVLSAVLVVGGRAMAQVKSYGLSMTAAWVAMVPLSAGWLPCFPVVAVVYSIGLIFAIITVSVMFKPDIKRAFRFNNPTADPDAAD